MRRSYSTFGIKNITVLVCLYTLVGCFGGSNFRGRGCALPYSERIDEHRSANPQFISNPLLPVGDPPFIIEEFIYTAGNPLDGSNGGLGWDTSWVDTSNLWTITAPGLTHPAQTSDTSVLGNNKVTGVNIGKTTPITSLEDHVRGKNLVPLQTSSTSIARFFSADSLKAMNDALNGATGLWFRCLVSIPSLPSGAGTPMIGFYAENMGFLILMSAQSGEYSFIFGCSYVTNSYAFDLDSTYMLIVNIVLSNASTGELTANLWILDPTMNIFDPNSTPSATATSCTWPLPMNFRVAAVGISDDSNDNIDEIYLAPSSSGLLLNLPSQTTRTR